MPVINTIELEGVSRLYRTPRVLDKQIALADYEGPLRQLVVTDLGHDFEIFLERKQLLQAITKDRVIVGDHDPDGSGRLIGIRGASFVC